jgi:cell fate regulator YaaT (PSP1 superfamily)
MTDNNHDNNVTDGKLKEETTSETPIDAAKAEPVKSDTAVESPPEEQAASETPSDKDTSEPEIAGTPAKEDVNKPDSPGTDADKAGKGPDATDTPAGEAPEKKDVKTTEVVGIRFRSCGKVYTFDANNIELAQGARVVVDSEMGLSMGYVVTPKHLRKNTKESLKKVVRLASDKDFETIESNRDLQSEAKAFCVEKSKELNLPMKVVTTEMTLDKKRLIFYFTADGRIDFRELVRDLAAKFKTRIEMRQIGVRDEVKMLGGIGVCGRQTCCNQFLTSFAPITIRMAKQQSLSINQSKLSGICGRLMCCLGYEYHDGPAEERAPRDKAVSADAKDSLKEARQTDDAEVIKSERPQEPGTARDTKKPVRPQQREQKEGTGEKSPEGEKPARSNRRRRRRRRGAKPSQENTGQVKPEASRPDAQKPAGEGEKKTTGRPSNKRKRFWKKKKKKEE